MKEAIAKNVIEESIYAKTTPKEYERFKQFVAETAPYDIVVDGLNVMLGGNEVGFKAKFDKVCKSNQIQRWARPVPPGLFPGYPND